MNSNDTPGQMLRVMLRSLSSSSDYIFNEEKKGGRLLLEIPLHLFLIQEAGPAKSSRNLHLKKGSLSSQTPHHGHGCNAISTGAMALGLVLELTALSAFRELVLSKGVKSWAKVMLLTELSPSFLNFQHFSSDL